MKITCDREKLLSAFQTAATVAPTRSPKPILQNIKLEVSDSKAMLIATDLEVGIRIEVPGVQTEVPGSAILSTSRFGSILRESSDEQLHLEANKQGLTVRGERMEFKLLAEDPEEFPAVAAFTEKKFHEVPARLLREIIRRTLFATDSESSRFALSGVLVEFLSESILAVGTDGRRLAKMEGPAQSIDGHVSGDSMTIIPARAMQLIERALSDSDAEIQVAARGNDILVKSPRVTIYSRLVEGRFPKWRDVFPKRENPVKIDLIVGPLYTAVRQAAIVTSEESRGVDFTFGGGTLVLAGQTAELGQSRVELPIPYEGPSISLVLDPRFLGDFLKVLNPEKSFSLEIKDSESAMVCSTDDGYGYVIMPMARDKPS